MDTVGFGGAMLWKWIYFGGDDTCGAMFRGRLGGLWH